MMMSSNALDAFDTQLDRALRRKCDRLRSYGRREAERTTRVDSASLYDDQRIDSYAITCKTTQRVPPKAADSLRQGKANSEPRFRRNLPQTLEHRDRRTRITPATNYRATNSIATLICLWHFSFRGVPRQARDAR